MRGRGVRRWRLECGSQWAGGGQRRADRGPQVRGRRTGGGGAGQRGWGSAGRGGPGAWPWQRRGRARPYLGASAVAVVPRPAGQRPGLPQQRGAGPRCGPRSRCGSGSSARSGPRSRSRTAAAAGLRMLARAVPAARAPGSPRSRSVARGPRLRPGVGGGPACTAQPPSGPGRTAPQRGAGLGGRARRRTTAAALCGRSGMARLRPAGGSRRRAPRGVGWGARARACEEGAGPRPPSRGAGLPPFARARPPLPWRRVAGRPAALL